MGPSLPLTSPALAVRGRGLARAGRGQKRKKTCCRESPAPVDVSELLNEDIWKTLPEEIFNLILERLPFAAQCRFRCLCRRWKGLQCLSPPAPCTIMTRAADQDAVFCCDAERKWISLPSSRQVPSGRNWELVDADAGLVCYQCNIDGWFWLWVCNPLNPSLSRLIQPTYERRDPGTCIPEAPPTKLLVDRASGAYKIIAKLDQLPCTAVYESTLSRWTDYESSPYMTSLEFFVWRNVLYAYNTDKDSKKVHRDVEARLWLTAFNMQTRRTRRWILVPLKIPSEVNFPTTRFILSNNEEVMLVLFSYRKRYQPYFSVWKLLDDGSISTLAPFGKLEKWEKIEIGSERAVLDLRGHRLARASYGGKHICFAFRDDNIAPDGSRGCKFVRYSFAAKRWSEMPCRRDGGGSFRLYYWEPSLDIDPR